MSSREDRKDEGWRWWEVAACVAGVAGLAAAAGGLYYMATRNQDEQTNQHQTTGVQTHDPDVDDDFGDNEDDEQPNATSSTGGLSSPVENYQGNVRSSSVPEDIPVIMYNSIVDPRGIPDKPYCMINLNNLLQDVYNRHVAFKKDEFERHYEVFNEVFNNLHSKMKTIDQYYNKYSSDVKFGGSHFNRIKIKKPYKYNVDVVIKLPVDMEYNPQDRDRNDVIIKPQSPGFVELRACEQYKNIPYREDSDINKVALLWLDYENYIHCSKFREWFQSIANKALNTFQKSNNLPYLEVDGVVYTIQASSSVMAWTIVIKAPSFQLNVDLVPALTFSERRWPISNEYREIPSGCETGYWMVVPKPNKMYDPRSREYSRSWRLSLQDQENKLFCKTDKMLKVICLINYYRDTKNMKEIPSSYITTIILNEAVELQKSDPRFWWKNDLQTCFRYMFNKFHTALALERIEYFWNKDHNLIGNMSSLCRDYKNTADELYTALRDPRDYKVKEVAKCLLPPDTYSWYKKCSLYFSAT